MVPNLDFCVDVYVVSILIINKGLGFCVESEKDEFRLGHNCELLVRHQVNTSNELFHIWDQTELKRGIFVRNTNDSRENHEK